MSRIGKQPIKIPENVEIKISVNSILVKGPKGEISKNLHPNVIVEEKDGEILVKPKNDSKESRALWGTYRSLINNMVKGVKDGFEKVLIYEGIGFKSEVKSDSLIESGKILELNVGFTHSVKVPAPKGIDFKVEKNQITVSGIDKELVGQVAADIRKVKPPEPYKGKGIRYKDEIILRKAGKKAATTG
ncbi:MAG: 50S ribosomal protein L6 [Parcubacteria group bacterium RIFCSPLOWO2_01_FULL_40_65]|nr:ribosomal protein L6 [uncultured bacterium]OHB17687.1 MAG: 50S ribosomal protein L6 [Parcubacteria group bacterium RIFCSPHIGHO2_01_FULL_40_30]OHB19865.1 MAG: 50S ribosomal protein L6 [Parcubacteria group bacterium RIFCSPHIGHO2_02_FULL_40_12]OHB21576.1 MAG: 50S ribosomal protein L6 [Parcubacteria group bacterium RIFCSPLOWO2_01_FULL_40_65]OHB23498.1 MAG: 50S ribosomal protein L6 [Parcubacteria group bacterium RIFCSPLOWO2_02_FULL_40_12]OHB24027.1 MAG: 50S ribosomal protein L6 [Parcubacteria gr